MFRPTSACPQSQRRRWMSCQISGGPRLGLSLGLYTSPLLKPLLMSPLFLSPSLGSLSPSSSHALAWSYFIHNIYEKHINIYVYMWCGYIYLPENESDDKSDWRDGVHYGRCIWSWRVIHSQVTEPLIKNWPVNLQQTQTYLSFIFGIGI